ncbi:MAG: HAD family hydrolase [Spirochaetia bacterium]|jgi:phosphoglycolate phosphatase/putative hydrolase of the HAD superfamily|nr:HAD family hydrolase [Spirochaetia bacterium]
MKVFRLPPALRAVIFDIDGTLYQHPGYVQHQIDILIAELARVRGWSMEAAQKAVADARASVAASQGTQTTSLGNAMAYLGIDMATSVAWRERLIKPASFLGTDPALRQSLLRLRDSGLVLVALTNNPRSTGEATLQALGVADLFRRVVGLDDTMKSKPAREPFLLAAKHAMGTELPGSGTELGGMGTEPAGGFPTCLAVGDRYDVDLAVPLELGMGAVLVDGVEDVYLIPGLIESIKEV